jgi:hypothetical protein
VSGLLLGSHAAAASAVGRIDWPAETSAAGSGVGDRWHGHLGRMASRGRRVWVASCRWCGRWWIVRRRTVRRAQPWCNSLSCAVRAGAWPGSVSTLVACHVIVPFAFATVIPSRVPSRIRSDSNSATTARTLNSSRPTGSGRIMDGAAETELDVALRELVQDVTGVGQGTGEPVQLGRHKCVGGPAGGQRQRRLGRSDLCRSGRGRNVGAIVAEAERVQGRRAERWDLAALLRRGRIPRSSSCRARTSGDGRGPPRDGKRVALRDAQPLV